MIYMSPLFYYIHTQINLLKSREINSNSQARVRSGKPIKCRISLFSRVEKTNTSIQKPRSIRSRVSRITTILTLINSCTTGSAFLFEAFSKLYKFAVRTVFKDGFIENYARKNVEYAYVASLDKYIENMKNRNTGETKTKRDLQLFEEFLRMENKEKKRGIHDCAIRKEQVPCRVYPLC